MTYSNSKKTTLSQKTSSKPTKQVQKRKPLISGKVFAEALNAAVAADNKKDVSSHKLRLKRGKDGLDRFYDENGDLVIPSNKTRTVEYTEVVTILDFDGKVVSKLESEIKPNRVVIRFTFEWWMKMILIGTLIGVLAVN